MTGVKTHLLKTSVTKNLMYTSELLPQRSRQTGGLCVVYFSLVSVVVHRTLTCRLSPQRSRGYSQGASYTRRASRSSQAGSDGPFFAARSLGLLPRRVSSSRRDGRSRPRPSRHYQLHRRQCGRLLRGQVAHPNVRRYLQLDQHRSRARGASLSPSVCVLDLLKSRLTPSLLTLRQIVNFYRSVADAKKARRDWYINSRARAAPNPPIDARNILRPETVESLFIAYRITGDPTYRTWVRRFDLLRRTGQHSD
jgi:hypothetical protein